MVPGIEALGPVVAQILGNLGVSSVRGMLKRRKEKKSELKGAELSTKPIRVSGQELEEPEKLAEVLERVEQLEQRQQDERVANVLSVLEKTVEALADKEVPDQQPDSRWVSVFTDCAQHASTDELRDTWARILAGETERPGSISVRTLNILNDLDQSTAWLFRRVCSIAVHLYYPDGTSMDSRVPFVDAEADPNSLKAYSLPYNKLAILNEYGLLDSGLGSWSDYQVCIAGQVPRVPDRHTGMRFTYQGQRWGLLYENEREVGQQLRVPGISLTRAGSELARVVEPEFLSHHYTALKEFFSRSGLVMAQRVGTYLQTL